MGWIVFYWLVGCGARTEPIDPRHDGGSSGRDASSAAADAGPPGSDAGDPRRDAGPEPPPCEVGQRFDVLRTDAFDEITGLDLARGDDGALLFFQSGAAPLGFVILLDESGEWTGMTTELGRSGPGSVARGRLDGAPGYTVVHHRAGGLEGIVFDENGFSGARSITPATWGGGRPGISIGRDVMVVAWSDEADITHALITDLRTPKSATVEFPGTLAAAATDGTEVETVVRRDGVVCAARFDAAGTLLFEGEFGPVVDGHDFVGLDMATTADATVWYGWAMRDGAPFDDNASWSINVPSRGATGRFERAGAVDGAVAHDEASNTTLSVLSLTRLGVRAFARQWDLSGPSLELEIATPVTPSVGEAPSVSVISTGERAFLVVWDDIVGGVHGISGRAIRNCP